jgi:uncharacterized RDD family membrane protein YckC
VSEPSEHPRTPPGVGEDSTTDGDAISSPGPFYGPVHRYGRPTAELPPGAQAAAAQVPHPPSPSVPRGWPPAPRPADWDPVRARPSGPGGWWPSPWRHDYASWGRRVLASAVDALPAWIAVTVLTIGHLPTYLGFFRGDLTVAPHYPLVVVGSLLCVAAAGAGVYNRWVLAGRTGQSVGKRVTRIWLVRQPTGRPVGALDAFVRDLLHVLDAIGLVGYLWPLWDEEHQTLADKVAQTVVVRTPVPPLTELERDRG